VPEMLAEILKAHCANVKFNDLNSEHVTSVAVLLKAFKK